MNNAWRGFKGSQWQNGIDVQEFIKDNYTEYVGDDSFLEGPTEATNELWQEIVELKKQEIANGGVLDADTSVISTITSHPS
jgi:formate C-acetyltransferase